MVNYEIRQLDSQTWSVENQDVRFFLLTGTKSALLIDRGMTTENTREIAESLTNLPLQLITTHADIDHIVGNEYHPRSHGMCGSDPVR